MYIKVSSELDKAFAHPDGTIEEKKMTSIASELIEQMSARQQDTSITLTYILWHLSQSPDLQTTLCISISFFQEKQQSMTTETASSLICHHLRKLASPPRRPGASTVHDPERWCHDWGPNQHTRRHAHQHIFGVSPSERGRFARPDCF